MKFNRIILASKSPRRHQLLKDAGFEVLVKTAECDESYPNNLISDEVAEYIAEKKAIASIGFLKSESDIIIAADTIVVFKNKILGKPKSYEDAFSTLALLSNNSHKVITGVCLSTLSKTEVFSSVSLVTFEKLSTEEIDYYINTFKPYDKAGSYGIQEWIGYNKISKIIGSYNNIMGLPTDKVYHHLKNW